MSNPLEHPFQSDGPHAPNYLETENSAESFLANAGRAFAYTAVQSPVDALMGADSKLHLVNAPQPARAFTSDWVAEQVGGGLGTVAQFAAAGFLIAKASAALKAGATETALTEATEVGNTTIHSVRMHMLGGLSYGLFLTPVQDKDNEFSQRLENGIEGAISFGALAGVGSGLAMLGKSSAQSVSTVLRNELASRTMAGAVTGVLNADIHAEVHNGRQATGQERLESALSYALIGGALSAGKQIYGLNSSGAVNTRELRSPPVEAARVIPSEFERTSVIDAAPPVNSIFENPERFAKLQRIADQSIFKTPNSILRNVKSTLGHLNASFEATGTLSQEQFSSAFDVASKEAPVNRLFNIPVWEIAHSVGNNRLAEPIVNSGVYEDSDRDMSTRVINNHRRRLDKQIASLTGSKIEDDAPNLFTLDPFAMSMHLNNPATDLSNSMDHLDRTNQLNHEKVVSETNRILQGYGLTKEEGYDSSLLAASKMQPRLGDSFLAEIRQTFPETPDHQTLMAKLATFQP